MKNIINILIILFGFGTLILLNFMFPAQERHIKSSSEMIVRSKGDTSYIRNWKTKWATNYYGDDIVFISFNYKNSNFQMYVYSRTSHDNIKKVIGTIFKDGIEYTKVNVLLYHQNSETRVIQIKTKRPLLLNAAPMEITILAKLTKPVDSTQQKQTTTSHTNHGIVLLK